MVQRKIEPGKLAPIAMESPQLKRLLFLKRLQARTWNGKRDQKNCSASKKIIKKMDDAGFSK